MTSIVILSPHIDDAVFSCWHLLTQPGATVITVFAGTPTEGTTTLWDRICGEPDSVTMMHKRAQENETILKEMGVPFYSLSYIDNQYRPDKHEVVEIAQTILSRASNDAEFFAPLAGSKIWRHPDHIMIRDVGKYLLNQGKKVSFYADIPYMQMPRRPSARYINRMSQRASKLIGTNISVEVSELSPYDQTSKRKAMLEFESQYKMTNLASLGTLGRSVNVQREVVSKPA